MVPQKFCPAKNTSLELFPPSSSGSLVGLVREIKQMNDVLKHSEAHITKTANESAHVRATGSMVTICNIMFTTPFLPFSEVTHAVPTPPWEERPPSYIYTILHPHSALCLLQNSPQKVRTYCRYLIGASVGISKPHTSELNSGEVL